MVRVEQEKPEIDTAHAKILARAIYRDVIAYVQSHQEEYQEYLKENGGKEEHG